MKLYKTIEEQVKNSSISYTILQLDSSMSIDDIIHDVYIKLYDKNNEYIYRKIKQVLIDIYRKKKVRKIETCEINDDIIQNNEYIDFVIINESIDYLSSMNIEIKDYVCDYFIKNMTYKEISKKYNKPINTLKDKIDKGLSLLKDYYKEV